MKQDPTILRMGTRSCHFHLRRICRRAGGTRDGLALKEDCHLAGMQRDGFVPKEDPRPPGREGGEYHFNKVHRLASSKRDD